MEADDKDENCLSWSDGESEKKIEIPEYDHFDTERTIKIIPVPNEIKRSEFGRISRSAMGAGSTRGRSKLEKILRQKLLEHKWGDAALIMEGIASDAIESKVAHTDLFWKVGNEVIYNHPATKYEPDLVKRHYQATKANKLVTNPAHILYEYTLYLLVKKDFKAAQEALAFFELTLHKSSVKGFYKRGCEWYDKWSPILSGYSGIIDYILWKEMGKEFNTDFAVSEDDPENSVKKLTAEQAVRHIEVVLSSSGVWDIFITKYVELLEYLGRIGDAEEALRSNSFKHPLNPNAHKYWYEFVCRHPEITDVEDAQIQALSKLHEVAPSDNYMLELHKLRFDSALKHTGDKDRLVSMVSLALGILLDMMDYDTWIIDENAWKTLASSLKKAKEVVCEQFPNVLDEIWFASKRNTWWPKYHFTPFRAKQALNFNVSFAKSKCLAASLFVGAECEFCNIIRTNK